MQAADRTALEPVSGTLDRELEHRLAVLRGLEGELTAGEAELERLLDELSVFEHEYNRVLGTRYQRLAELVGAVGELRERAAKGDDGEREPGEDGPVDGPVDGIRLDDEAPARPKPPETARRLFRRLARRIHPDLAADDAERARRTRLMMAANQAYQDGDADRLRELLEDEELGPDGVSGDGPVPDLVRVIRRIGRATKRLDAIRKELRSLHESPMGILLAESAEAGSRGFDLLADMAVELDRLIERTEAELAELG
jgi:hypothetical protein